MPTRTLIVLSLLATACVGPTIPQAKPPRPAEETIEAFVRFALADRVAAGDIPNWQLLPDPKKVLVRKEVWAETGTVLLSAGALPEAGGVKLTLTTEEDAQREADRTGNDVYYLGAADPEVGGSTAQVRFGVEFAVPRKPGRIRLCCCWAPAFYKRVGDKWQFAGWLRGGCP